MDDLILCTKTWAHDKRLIEDTLAAFMNVGLTLRPSKAQFGPQRVRYLGYQISRKGLRVGKDRVQAIIYIKQPLTAQ